MTAIHGDRVRRLMVENHLSVNQLLARLRQTDDNERVNRGTLSGVINNSYRAKPSAHLVALRLLRMVIDELPPAERVRLIHYLIKQAGIYKETFRAQTPSRNPVPETDSGG